MRKIFITTFAVLLGLVWPLLSLANDVVIVDANASFTDPGWRFNVTLRHDDSGWDHYADAWRVIDSAGKVFGTRTLFHPHENEQPFTRSLGDVKIPAKVTTVYIEAHDKVHGWGPEKLKLELSK